MLPNTWCNISTWSYDTAQQRVWKWVPHPLVDMEFWQIFPEHLIDQSWAPGDFKKSYINETQVWMKILEKKGNTQQQPTFSKVEV